VAGKHLPTVVEWPIAAALRTAMTAPLIMGLDPARRAAKMLGELYPRLQPARFERAVRNLEDAFPEWTPAKRREVAVASYQHVFQLGVEILYSPRLITEEGFTRHLFFADIAPGLRSVLSGEPCVLITGHTGNWELIGYAISMLGFPMSAVYRPLDLRPLDRWLYETRRRRGLTLVSKFGAVRALPPVLRAGRPVGLVADQSGGDRGLFVPFFGRLTSTYKSIGLLALQTRATLVCGMARRLSPGEAAPPPALGGEKRAVGPGSLGYAIEMVDQFGPGDWEGQPDPLFYITARFRRSIELMVRRSPEQYFWMHRVWRSRPAHERQNKPFPPLLREKLASLPWMTAGDVEAVVARSDEDRGSLTRLQT
jgi:Kdo2-lipid IVA lauroyltransferase/acyltransferase